MHQGDGIDESLFRIDMYETGFFVSYSRVLDTAHDMLGGIERKTEALSEEGEKLRPIEILWENAFKVAMLVSIFHEHRK
jgi:hypothetical protein